MFCELNAHVLIAMRDIYTVNKQMSVILFLPVKAYALINITANNYISKIDVSGQTIYRHLAGRFASRMNKNINCPSKRHTRGIHQRCLE
jgi:hypothetical protein